MEGFIDRLVEVRGTCDEIYRGYVVSIDPTRHELVLRNVKDMKTGELRMNQYHFFKEMISDIKICEEDHKVRGVCDDKGKSGPNGVHNLSSDKNSYQGDMLLMDASDDEPSLFQRQHIDPTLYLTDYAASASNVEFGESAQQTMLIDDMGDNFDEAISKIKQEKIISFAIEGRRVIRKGDLSLVVIGTRPLVYIFDVRQIGPRCMTNGLKSILEDKVLLKVVFDIRMVSDCLASLYKVYPVNVFDCQVADLFIHKRKYRQYPSEVSTLSDCLQKYLNIPRNQCSFESDKKKLIQKNNKLWIDRPFPDDFIDYCYKSVMFIRELRDPMIRQLLAEFLCGVDMYLDCVRSMPDHAMHYFNPRKVPKTIFNIGTYKDKKTQQRNPQKMRIYEKHAVQEDRSDKEMPEESPWGAGLQFIEKYQERHGEIIECLNHGPSLIDCSKPLLKMKQKTCVSASSPKNIQENIPPDDENVSEDVHGMGTVGYFNDNEGKDGSGISSDGEHPVDLQNDMSDLLNVNVGAVSDCRNIIEQMGEQKERLFSLKMFSNINISPQKSNSLQTFGNYDISHQESNSPKTFTNINTSQPNSNSPKSVDNNASPRSLNSPKIVNIHKPRIDELYPDSSEENSKGFEKFQISTSEFESDDSDIFLSSLNDISHKKGLNFVNNNPWPNNPSDEISDAGKRVIRMHKTPTVDLKPCNNTYSPDFNEFPPLGKNTYGKSNKHSCSNHSMDTNNHGNHTEFRELPIESFDEIRSRTPEHMNGLKQTVKPKVSGRGQTLQFIAEQGKKIASKNVPRYLDEGKRKTYEFPPDEELLNVPHVTPMIRHKPIAGEVVNIIKKLPQS